MSAITVMCFKAFRAGVEDGLNEGGKPPTWVTSFQNMDKAEVLTAWEEGCHLGKQLKRTINLMIQLR